MSKCMVQDGQTYDNPFVVDDNYLHTLRKKRVHECWDGPDAERSHQDDAPFDGVGREDGDDITCPTSEEQKMPSQQFGFLR